MTIGEYYLEELGCEVTDPDIAMWPRQSPTGGDMWLAIVRVAVLLSTLDPHPTVRGPILQGLTAHLRIIAHG